MGMATKLLSYHFHKNFFETKILLLEKAWTSSAELTHVPEKTSDEKTLKKYLVIVYLSEYFSGTCVRSTEGVHALSNGKRCGFQMVWSYFSPENKKWEWQKNYNHMTSITNFWKPPLFLLEKAWTSSFEITHVPEKILMSKH